VRSGDPFDAVVSLVEIAKHYPTMNGDDGAGNQFGQIAWQRHSAILSGCVVGWLFLPQMTRVFRFDLAINEQDHVFAVATSPDLFLAGFDIALVNRKSFDSALAVVDRADVTNGDFVVGHDPMLRVSGMVSAPRAVVSV
jgi:hypothetical protein